MFPADQAFALAANAADAAWRARPAFITYVARSTVSAPTVNYHKSIDRAVIVRTADDLAIVQDLPQGRQQVTHAFPILPTFDALSYFRLVNNGSARDILESHVEPMGNITFAPPTPGAGHADVVVTTLRNYYATYDADSNDQTLHVDLKPLPALTRNNPSDLFLHDLRIDAATNLPVEVTYTGHDDRTFRVHYAVVQGHWLIDHVFYEQTFYPPLRLARVHATVDADLGSWGFPQTAPDARLQPEPKG
jgi:hypothetical protein